MEGFKRLKGKRYFNYIIPLIINLFFYFHIIFAKTSIGILPIENQTKKTRYDWIGFGIEYILYNKLSNISAFYVPEKQLIKEALDKSGYKNKELDGRLIYHIGKEALINIAIVGSYQTDGKDIIFIGEVNLRSIVD